MREKLKTIGQDNVSKHAGGMMSASWVEQVKREVWDSKALGFFMLFILMSAIFVSQRPEYYFPFLFHYPERSELQEVSGTLSYKINITARGSRGRIASNNSFIISSIDSPETSMELFCSGGAKRWTGFFAKRHCSKYGLPQHHAGHKYSIDNNVWHNAKVLYHPVFGIFEISINGEVSTSHSYDKTISDFQSNGFFSIYIILLFFALFYLGLLLNYRQYRKNNAFSTHGQRGRFG